MASIKVLLEWESESNVWVTHVPALGNISTYGETEEEALEMTKDLIIGYFEALNKLDNGKNHSQARVVELAV